MAKRLLPIIGFAAVCLLALAYGFFFVNGKEESESTPPKGWVSVGSYWTLTDSHGAVIGSMKSSPTPGGGFHGYVDTLTGDYKVLAGFRGGIIDRGSAVEFYLHTDGSFWLPPDAFPQDPCNPPIGWVAMGGSFETPALIGQGNLVEAAEKSFSISTCSYELVEIENWRQFLVFRNWQGDFWFPPEVYRKLTDK
jgi:hypothetical protein